VAKLIEILSGRDVQTKLPFWSENMAAMLNLLAETSLGHGATWKCVGAWEHGSMGPREHEKPTVMPSAVRQSNHKTVTCP
jgi:hypothetical protein